MNKLIGVELLKLKKQILNKYQPILISEQAMGFLLSYSNEIPYELHSDLHSLIAIDMGEEFVLQEDECIKIIEKLLIQLNIDHS
ncbi:hypothetical protein [Psychrobacter sp. M13]|uniref:hypothetical protein n=1 Tax=Psychrobacter sp. M13 TaxID=3067275 RepID=UPI00273C576B|nr:hypothetical protein [Psychrobacter sp. M13]WLP95707.1 hypothetical protein Q9G97_06330 [Psychrobacter sp. M13]